MNKKRAFTLIELLVVIAIIALLMAILIPALGKAKKHATAVACLAVKHQMAIATAAYTIDNDGMFWGRAGVGSIIAYQKLWMYVLKPYYKEPKMRFCPAAMNPKKVTGPFGTWDYAGRGSYSPTADPSLLLRDESEFDIRVQQVVNGFFTGSICLNRFVENMTAGPDARSERFWRTTNIKGADKVPVFVDSQYCYVSVYSNETDPPEYDGDFTGAEMHWLTINRHMGSVAAVFADWSARMVGLKELWTLKWSRDYNTCGPWTKCGNRGNPSPRWNNPRFAWMKGFKDY